MSYGQNKSSGGFWDGLVELGKEINDQVEKEDRERKQVNKVQILKISSLEDENKELRDKLLAEKERVLLAYKNIKLFASLGK